VRANAGANASAAAAAYEEEDDDDSVQTVHSEAGDHQADAEEQDLSAIPLDIMSAAQLKKAIWPLGIGRRGCYVATSE
jgi:hypothetical protein